MYGRGMLDLSIAAATTRCCCLVSDRDAIEIVGGGDKKEEEEREARLLYLYWLIHVDQAATKRGRGC